MKNQNSIEIQNLMGNVRANYDDLYQACSAILDKNDNPLAAERLLLARCECKALEASIEKLDNALYGNGGAL